MQVPWALLSLIVASSGPLFGQESERPWDHMGIDLEVIEGGAGDRIVVAGGRTRVHVFSADGDRIRTHEGVALGGGGDGEYFLRSTAGGYEERDVGAVVARTGKWTAVAVESPLPEPLRFGHWTHELVPI